MATGGSRWDSPAAPRRVESAYRPPRGAEHAPRRRAARTGSPVQTTIRGIGELFITLGLVVLLFAGYELWGKSAEVNAAQGTLDDQLDATWADKDDSADAGEQGAAPLPGDAIARMYIPRLNNHWVVVEGVAPEDIKNAPGHYPDSAMPGEVGNFSIAGHRMPAIFRHLDQLRAGDAIVVETQTDWYVYHLTESHIVQPHQNEVVAPVPGDWDAEPTEAMLTLTTCEPWWDNYERLIVHAQLDRSQPKSEGSPDEVSDLLEE